MGVIRLLLAFSVVICHVGFGSFPVMAIPGTDGVGFRLIPADLAVQCFFVVSGFYMSLILGKSYSLDRKGLKRFYSNRLLRLAPTYWALLILFFGVALHSGRLYRFELAQLFDILGKLPWTTTLAIVFVNVTMIGQDFLLFLGLTETGHLQWTGDMNAGPIPLQFFIMNPPSWSLALELWFYMLAPWFAGRNWKILLGVCFASFALRMILVANGFQDGAWGDRFFPTELLMFVGGMLLERFYRTHRSVFSNKRSAAVVVSVLIAMLAYPHLPVDATVMHWGFLASFAMAVPFIFDHSKDSAWDRSIGELSYPLYLGHLWIQMIVVTYMGLNAFDTSWVVAILSLVFAVAIHYGLERPIEGVRRRIKRLSSTNL